MNKARPYWIPIVENNRERIQRALKMEVNPQSEWEARELYHRWVATLPESDRN